jgi:hypothetical protein
MLLELVCRTYQMAVRLVGYKRLQSMQCVMSTADKIKTPVIKWYSYCKQECETEHTEWKSISQEAFSGTKEICSGRIQTHIFRKTSVTAAGIFSHTLGCKQAACTQNCHKIAIRLSAQQNTACVIIHVRDSYITTVVSNGDFVLKPLQLDRPTNLQNHDIPNSYGSKSDFTVQYCNVWYSRIFSNYFEFKVCLDSAWRLNLLAPEFF